MSRVPFRANQPLLFSGWEQKQNRTTWPLRPRELHERLCDSQDRSATGRVIERPIINRVAILIGRADAEVIPVSRKHNVLIAQTRVAPSQRADNVGRLHSL